MVLAVYRRLATFHTKTRYLGTGVMQATPGADVCNAVLSSNLARSSRTSNVEDGKKQPACCKQDAEGGMVDVRTRR